MLLSVHDELVFEVPEEVVDEATNAVKEVMEGAADLRCRLVVDVHTSARTGPTPTRKAP